MAKKSDLSRHIVAAAMELAGENGWRAVTLSAIAERISMPLEQIYDTFRNRSEILAGFTEEMDRAVLAGGPAKDELARDRLFDVMMRRYEAMAPYRPGLRRLGEAADPVTALCSGPRLMRSCGLMLETAGISASGAKGFVQCQGLAAIHLYVMRCFLRDDSEDLAKTMAELDKALRRAETVANTLWGANTFWGGRHRRRGGGGEADVAVQQNS